MPAYRFRMKLVADPTALWRDIVVGAAQPLTTFQAAINDVDGVNYPSLLARGRRRSLSEGGAFMWTPGNQSPVIGRGPSSVIVPRFIRTSTGASPLPNFCRERRL